MNEFYFFLSILVSFSLVLLFYKLLGKIGMFIWIAVVAVIANIEVIKCIDVFGMPITLGNALYCSISLATDITNEKYGAKEARKSAWIGFLSLVTLVILSQISLLFIPNSFDNSSEALKTIFSTTPRLCLASISCFILSNIMDTYIFSWIKKNNNMLWIRVNVSTIISQILDSFLFFVIAFLGVMSLDDIFVLGLTCYIVKVVITMCNTPFVYWSRNIKPIKKYSYE